MTKFLTTFCFLGGYIGLCVNINLGLDTLDENKLLELKIWGLSVCLLMDTNVWFFRVSNLLLNWSKSKSRLFRSVSLKPVSSKSILISVGLIYDRASIETFVGVVYIFWLVKSCWNFSYLTSKWILCVLLFLKVLIPLFITLDISKCRCSPLVSILRINSFLSWVVFRCLIAN